MQCSEIILHCNFNIWNFLNFSPIPLIFWKAPKLRSRVSNSWNISDGKGLKFQHEFSCLETHVAFVRNVGIKVELNGNAQCLFTLFVCSTDNPAKRWSIYRWRPERWVWIFVHSCYVFWTITAPLSHQILIYHLPLTPDKRELFLSYHTSGVPKSVHIIWHTYW